MGDAGDGPAHQGVASTEVIDVVGALAIVVFVGAATLVLTAGRHTWARFTPAPLFAALVAEAVLSADAAETHDPALVLSGPGLALCVVALVIQVKRLDLIAPARPDGEGGLGVWGRSLSPRGRGPGGGEPSWWPGFEAEFRAYAAAQELLGPPRPPRPSAWSRRVS